jgi:glyoxylase-like metal-dependent hydrolase (beta-lactamase superfamily II)
MSQTINRARMPWRPSRRALLAGLGGAAAASVLPGSRCAAAEALHRFKLGAFEVSVLSDGTFNLPVSFVLPGREAADITKVLGSPPGEVFTVQVNVTVVRTPDALVLIDTGGGDFTPTIGKLADNLEAAGVSPEAVTHVIFTHAHGDHLWGVIDPLDGGTRFPKARHIITAAERDFWTKPGVENEVPEALQRIAVGSARRLGIIADRIEIRRPGEEVLPGIALVDTSGHSPGHVSVHLKSGSDQLIVGGDALTHAQVSFSQPDWRWGSDMDGEKGIATRKRLLDQLANDRIPLLGYHLPWPGLGRVERKDAAYRFVSG